MLNKVPEITVFFWIIKILATTVGETAADFLATKLHVDPALVIGAIFVIALIVQLRAQRYIPALYWTVVVLISVVGTLVSDNLTDKLGLSLTTTTIAFTLILAAVFYAWWRSERILSVHTITTTRREVFYWAAILFTFALGTSAGDLLATASGIGFGLSVLVFAGMIGIVAFAYYVLNIDGVLAFWIAYILTRPLGASLGDLLSQAHADGGLGFGTTVTSGAFLAAIVALVAYLSVTRCDRIARTYEPGVA